MTLQYLLDSNTVSAAFGTRRDPGIAARLLAFTDEAAIASVVWHELRYGLLRLPESARKRLLEDFLETVVHRRCPILPYTETAAEWHARERARLEPLGKTPPFRDGQIAATAAVNGLILVTANVRDFEAFAGLTIEDWSTAG